MDLLQLFTSEPSVVQAIATTLVTCGCCARCILRYLGLKDMHSYRRNTQEMEKLIVEITGSQLVNKADSEITGSQLVKEPDLTTIGSGTEVKACSFGEPSSEALVSANHVEDNTSEFTMEVNVPTKIGDINESAAVNGDIDMEQNMDTVRNGIHAADVKLIKEETVSATAVLNESTDLRMSETCHSSMAVQSHCENKVGEHGAVTEAYADSDIDKGNIGSTSTDSNRVLSKSNGSGDGGKTAVSTGAEDTKKAPCCVVCLGILKEFASAEFLDQIKLHSRGAEFEFSSYICNLKIPVSIILREHAMLLYLKEKFMGIYELRTMSDIASVKDVWKWRNGPELRDVLDAPFDQKSPFDISLTFVYKDSNKECNFLLDVKSDTFRNRKQDRRYNKRGNRQLFTRVNVDKAVGEMSDDTFRSNFQCPPTVPNAACHCDIACQNEPVFVAGRYNKYSRTLSQTPWIIEGTRKSESSVEELICTEIDKIFKPAEHKFSSSGREDVDVLMLGNGRPFVIELVNPKRVNFSQEEITPIQTVINKSTEDIRIQDLQIVSRESTEKLKEGEIDKVKTYSALCWSPSLVTDDILATLTQLKDLTILQKTPVRVLHRRPLATRDKLIHSMSVVKTDDHHFRVILSTQAGTYIKEFVHGDFGRTRPNMGTILGIDCDIVELDVESVELDWPKKLG